MALTSELTLIMTVVVASKGNILNYMEARYPF